MLRLNAVPFLWRAERLADQIGDVLKVQIPKGGQPGRLAAFRLKRALDTLRAQRHDGLVQVQVDGYAHPVWVRGGSSDLDVVEQLLVHHELGFELEEAPRTIIDLGANIGLSAVYFARRFPHARIIAVEVESANFALLQRNCAPYPQIVALKKAIWQHGGHVRITNPDAQPWSFRVQSTTGDDPAAIEAVSMNELMRDHGLPSLDLVKMDIEGAEAEVLSAGLHPWLDHTRVLAVELHERHKPGCEAALENAVAGRVRQRRQIGEYAVLTLS